MIPRLRISLWCLLGLAISPHAWGQQTDQASRLHYDAATSIPLTVGASALWLGSEFPLKGTLSPDSCRWCDRSADGRDALNRLDASIRSRLLWKHPARARRMSDLLLFVGVPATALGTTWLVAREDGRERESGRNSVMILEAMAVSTSLNQIVKFTVGRQRPYLHFDPEVAKRSRDSDDNLSFYSGHVADTFTMATAAGTVATLRGYRNRGWIWIPGLTLAAATSYFRIACDRHYFTDVAAGIVVGSAVGVALPRIMHARKADSGAGTASLRSPAVPPTFVVRLTW